MTAARPQGAPTLVFRNALRLLVAQVAGMPLSMALTAVMARYIGSADFGLYYLATTFGAFALLPIDWGQSSAVPAIVARERTRAGEILGSVVAWRVGVSVIVYAILAGACVVLGYAREFQIVLALTMLNLTLNSFTAAHADIFRGFERTDIIGFVTLAGELSRMLLAIPVLLLGGGLRGALLADAVGALGVLAVVARVVRKTLRTVSFRFDLLKSLLIQGTPFLLFALAVTLQPSIDGVFLSKLASPQAVGWYAAASKLIGVLVLPANALIVALYPTLCRLHVRDIDGFRKTISSALRLTSVLVIPIVLGCALYPDVAVGIFSHEEFGPAATDLRILSVFLFIVYFTMPIGVSVLAAGRQRAWATIQFGCVIVSSGLDFVLIRFFQTHLANGGLGSCVTTVVSESVMLTAGMSLLPRGTFDAALWRQLALAVLAGAAMCGAAYLTSDITPFVAAPLAVIAYVVCLIATGAIDREQVHAFRALLTLKAPA